MEKSNLIHDLDDLAKNKDKRTKTALVEEHIEKIEAAIKAGVKRPVIVKALKSHGIEFTKYSFDTTLRRVRQKRLAQNSQTELTNKTNQIQKPISSPVNPTISKPSQNSQTTNSHDPAELNRIMSSQPDLEALAKFAPRKIK